jgi:CheY-like chemotaxis protein
VNREHLRSSTDVARKRPGKHVDMCKILVVDDEPLIRRNLRRMLEREGHEVRESADGVEAMRIVDAGFPEIVITDLQMPGIDGFELIRAVRKSPEPQPKIILCSGSRDAPELEIAIALGASVLLEKPFSFAELLASVQKARTAA